jgi:hypothetical protein
MRHPVLGPRKRELNELTARDGSALQVEEVAWIRELAGQLGKDRVPASSPEAPIRYCCIERSVVGEDVGRHVACFDAGQEPVDCR